MSGILVYSEDEARRNAFAVNKFLDNLDVSLVTEEKLDCSENPDFVVNRTNNAEIAKRFEEKGIRVFNPSSLTALANDKQKCYEFMRDNGIKILPVDYKGFPVIIKPVDGKGGRGVRLVESGKITFEKGFVYQKVASEPGKDLRVWLIGKRIVAAMLRKSRGDFRANFCLGGSASPYTLSEKEKSLVMKIAGLINYDYIGIDFVFDDSEIVFNEIEDAVGARMLYALTDIDILEEYCEYIKTEIKLGRGLRDRI